MKAAVGANYLRGGAEGARLNLPRGAERDNFSLVDDGDAVAQALRFLDVVRGDQDGAAGVAQFADEAVNLEADLRIEAGGGLV